MLELQRGSLFAGRYAVMRCIGAGGMGAVYLAHDLRYRNFPVALKVLYPGIIRSKELRERFKNEIIASYRISHKNIVRAYEYFDEENMQAYAMEYVEGSDLHQKMKDGKMQFKAAAGILRQAAAGLEAIHSEGILHRDLKPENIMLTKRGLVKIADFGVARLRGENTSITQAGMMVGTPRYFAPEYVELGECDQRGDIFALGVIGYELLVGSSPFPIDENLSTMLERFERRAPSLNEVVPECPAELAAIIEKAIAFSLGKRYQSAAQLRADLEAFEKKEPLIYAELKHPHKSRPCAGTSLKVSEVQNIPALGAASAGAELQNSGQAKVQPRSHQDPVHVWRRLHVAITVIGLVVIALAAALIGVYINHWRRQHLHAELSVLTNGRYSGFINGLDSKGVPLLLRVSGGERYIWLGLPGCEREVILSSYEIDCGAKSYRLSVSAADHFGALGVIEESPGGIKGRWSVVREDG